MNRSSERDVDAEEGNNTECWTRPSMELITKCEMPNIHVWINELLHVAWPNSLQGNLPKISIKYDEEERR